MEEERLQIPTEDHYSQLENAFVTLSHLLPLWFGSISSLADHKRT